MSKFPLLGPFGLSTGWDGAADARVFPLGSTFIYIDSEISPDNSRLIAKTLRVFPNPALERFAAGRVFHVVSRSAYETLPKGEGVAGTERMGIKVQWMNWYFREDLFRKDQRDKLVQKVWYASGGILSADLKGEEGFDGPFFRAVLNRYLRARVGSPVVEPWVASGYFLHNVDPMYQTFLDNLLELDNFDQPSIRRTFRESRKRYENTRVPAKSRKKATLARRNPILIVENSRRVYDEFVGRGLIFNLGEGYVLNTSLENARSRERVDSSHRLDVNVSNDEFNVWMDEVAARFMPGTNPQAAVAAGLVASYETRIPGEEKKEVNILAGAMFDFAFAPGEGAWGVHSYVGAPIHVRPGASIDELKEKGVFGAPQCELGAQYSGKYFAGLTVAFSESGYYGFVVRGDL